MTHILIVIVLSGFGGGAVNYLNTRPASDQGFHFLRCILTGIAAAFVVPLFLQTIQNGLLSPTEVPNRDLLILSGFCILASFAAKPFLDSMARRALEEAQQSKREAENATKNTEFLVGEIESLYEDENTSGSGKTTMSLRQGGQSPTLPDDGNARKVLEVLIKGPYTFRSMEGLTQQTGLSRDEVNGALNWLKQCGLADKSARTEGPRWYATRVGRQYLQIRVGPKNFSIEP